MDSASNIRQEVCLLLMGCTSQQGGIFLSKIGWYSPQQGDKVVLSTTRCHLLDQQVGTTADRGNSQEDSTVRQIGTQPLSRSFLSLGFLSLGSPSSLLESRR